MLVYIFSNCAIKQNLILTSLITLLLNYSIVNLFLISFSWKVNFYFLREANNSFLLRRVSISISFHFNCCQYSNWPEKLKTMSVCNAVWPLSFLEKIIETSVRVIKKRKRKKEEEPPIIHGFSDPPVKLGLPHQIRWNLSFVAGWFTDVPFPVR